MDEDLRSIQEVRDLLGRATSAQARAAEFSQEAIDRIVDAVAVAAAREARRLAALAVEETGFGNVADKTTKNRFAARTIHQFIRPLKTVGVLREDPDRGLVEIACPKGVVAAIIPSTNPTSTAIYKILIALKAGCGIVLSPHPAALRCIRETAAVCEEAARRADAPDGIIGCLTLPGERSTAELMRHRQTSVILATGGLGLVRAAYSAGKPAFGVGPGNVPAFIERTADIVKAVRDVVAGKTFDYGTICSSEQAVVVDRPVRDHVVSELKRAGAYFLSRAEIDRLGPLVITPDRRVSNQAVGRAAPVLARLAGIDVPETTTVLVAELDRVGPEEPLSLEKLCPILALYVDDGWERACERCVEILSNGGLGHTLSIHSQDERVIRAFGIKKPVFRIIVNSPTTHGAIGLTTGVDPSMTLGCGALGGNITSDNITPLHLIDVKRLAYEIREVTSYGDPVPGWPVGKGRKPFARPLVVAAAPAPSAAPGAAELAVAAVASARPGRAEIERVVAEFLAARGTSSSLPPTASIAVPPPALTARLVEVADATLPVEFVCEDDVRRAVRERREIRVGPRTIITPAARDLGESQRVFRRAG